MFILMVLAYPAAELRGTRSRDSINIYFCRMNLVVDIGNTRTKTGVFSEDELIHAARHPSTQTFLLQGLLKKYPDINKMIYSCVGALPEWLNDAGQKIQTVMSLNPHTLLPIENLYLSKETLGYDRIATAVGANNIYPGKDVLIIDAGTAITYDLVDSRANFLGGNIAPGLQMRLRSLKEFTSGLPLAEAVQKPPLIGKTTSGAIQSGVFWGIVYEMEGHINRLKEIYPELITVLTGGDSAYFEKNIKNTIFVVQNLNLIGLNRILNYNANQTSS